MQPPTETVTSNEIMPRQTEIVVIGGGIIGVSTALFLAMAGVPVVLCEKGEIAGEQSSRNWGWVRRMGRDPRELPLIVEAIKIWEDLSQMLGEDVGYRQTGILYACENAGDEAQREAWLRAAGPYSLDTHMMRGQSLADLLPSAAKLGEVVSIRQAMDAPNHRRLPRRLRAQRSDRVPLSCSNVPSVVSKRHPGG